MGEVRDRQSGRRATVLVKKDQVRQAGGDSGGDEIGEDEIAPVQADGGWQEESDFFGKRREPGGWVARSCHEHAGVNDTGELSVFVVQIKLFLRGPVRARLVVLEIFAQFFVVGDCRVERPAGG